ncbi:oxidoreductase [Trinickia terrae]|uniref:Oxidoreductase n=2 Tax=Trinickia terrae TaxID=2571161 RepID=A0A4U1IA17_9BURK|nr:oxidoreductase [Trinickia terrae]
MKFRVFGRRSEALDVISLDLRPLDPTVRLQPHTAGSHVDIRVSPEAPWRQYSVCNAPGETHRYLVGVALAMNSRGGSSAIHSQVRVGDIIEVSAPRNHFGLREEASHSVLIAGGIGVTPILAMARRLHALGRRFTVYYCVRSPARAAFAEELEAVCEPGECNFVFDGLFGGGRLDFEALVRKYGATRHYYCCGPERMLNAFSQATERLPESLVHSERFQAAPQPQVESTDGFVVSLARTGRELPVPPGRSVLEVLENAGVAIASSCRDGVCGTCEVRVLEGQPDHRDWVLSERERQQCDRMLVCVSRSKGERIVLDI